MQLLIADLIPYGYPSKELLLVPEQSIELASNKRGYLPTLDGWRALAVFGVIFYHDRVHTLGRFSDAPVHHFGLFGVNLFFAISGLLICSRLLEEEHIFHRIRLKDFYIRRVFRILPPAILFLLTVAGLGLLHIIHVGRMEWLSSLFFFRNYYTAIVNHGYLSRYTAHYWSLSVEEHFYFLLPCLLVFFPKQRMRLLGFLCAAFFAYDLIEHAIPSLFKAMGGDPGDVRTELQIISLLFPALLAVLLTRVDFRAWCQRWLTPWRTLLLFAILWTAAHFLVHMWAAIVLVPLGFPFLILSTVLHPRSLSGRLLELRALKFLGRISYSLYLWQQLFFLGDDPSARGVLGYLQHWPISMAVTLLCALGSYYLIERPFIHLGHRLAPPATIGRPA